MLKPGLYLRLNSYKRVDTLLISGKIVFRCSHWLHTFTHAEVVKCPPPKKNTVYGCRYELVMKLR